MVEKLTDTLPCLFEQDETAWLEITARLVAAQRWDELDQEHLGEYLNDMARRDHREVLSRLVVLLAHLLKWEKQPEQRNRSWEATIKLQRRELQNLLESATLRKHAVEVLGKAYAWAVEQASTETG